MIPISVARIGVINGAIRAAPRERWTPLNLTNDFAWYVSDNPDNTITDDLTVALADKSGHGWTAYADAAGASMDDTLEGRPVLRTSGGSGVFVSIDAGNALGRSAGAVSFYVVNRLISRDGASFPAICSISFGNATSTLQTALLRSETGTGWIEGSVSLRTRPLSGYPGIEIGDNTDYSGDWIIVGASRRYATDDGHIRINGTETASGSMDSDNVTADVDLSLVIGSYNGDGGDAWTHNIAEIVAVRNSLSLEDEQRLEGYYAWEWNMVADLPVDHPYKTAAPLVQPVLDPSSDLVTAQQDTELDVSLATVTIGHMVSIVDVSPALPDGLSVSIVDDVLKLTGTPTSTSILDDYLITVSVTEGPDLVFTLSLIVNPAQATIFDVVFNGSSSDTELIDAVGTVWTRVGGATLDGEVPIGGGFRTNTSAAMAAALMGTGDFYLHLTFRTTKSSVTLWDLGSDVLGLPSGTGYNGGTGNPNVDYYSDFGSIYTAASLAPYGADFANGSDITIKWRRENGVIKLSLGDSDMWWADAAETVNYSVIPTEITLGCNQADPSSNPFEGTIISAKMKVGVYS